MENNYKHVYPEDEVKHVHEKIHDSQEMKDLIEYTKELLEIYDIAADVDIKINFDNIRKLDLSE